MLIIIETTDEQLMDTFSIIEGGLIHAETLALDDKVESAEDLRRKLVISLYNTTENETVKSDLKELYPQIDFNNIDEETRKALIEFLKNLAPECLSSMIELTKELNISDFDSLKQPNDH